MCYKYFFTTLVAISLLLPHGLFAANDVVVDKDISVTFESPSTTITIKDTTVDKIVVNTGNVVITMSSGGEDVTIVSNDRYKFTVSGITQPSTNCNVNDSNITLSAQSSTVEVTVTPDTICDAISVTSGGSVPFNPVPATSPMTSPITGTGTVTANSSEGGRTTLSTTADTEAGVEIPVDAISEDTVFSIKEVATNSIGEESLISAVPLGLQIVGASFYDYEATKSGTSEVISSFDKDLTLTFTYTDEQVEGLDEDTLGVHYYDSSTANWIVLSTAINKELNKLTAVVDHFTRFAIFGGVAQAAPVEEDVNLVDVNGNAIIDGDLITTIDSFDIYIVKLIGEKKFKRLILNPDIFNSYGHLSWDNVKTVSQVVQDAYILSELVIEVNEDGSVFDPKVYKVSSALNSDVGQKQWLNITVAQFEEQGYDWDAIYKVNHTEASPNFYPEGEPITSS